MLHLFCIPFVNLNMPGLHTCQWTQRLCTALTSVSPPPVLCVTSQRTSPRMPHSVFSCAHFLAFVFFAAPAPPLFCVFWFLGAAATFEAAGAFSAFLRAAAIFACRALASLAAASLAA